MLKREQREGQGAWRHEGSRETALRCSVQYLGNHPSIGNEGKGGDDFVIILVLVLGARCPRFASLAKRASMGRPVSARALVDADAARSAPIARHAGVVCRGCIQAQYTSAPSCVCCTVL